MEWRMQGFDASQPFVLLDDAREGMTAAPARLFTRPRGVISASSPDQVENALEQLRLAIALGRTAAGFIGYDAGLALEERLRSEEHTSELQSLMRISYAVFCLKKKNTQPHTRHI